MRGRWIFAALLAAAPVLLFGAVTVLPALAQDNPVAAEDAADPNAEGTAPAEQQADTPDAAMPADTAPGEQATAPADSGPITDRAAERHAGSDRRHSRAGIPGR